MTNIYPKISYHNNPRIKTDTAYANLEKDLFTIKYPNQVINLNRLIVGNYTFKSSDSFKKLNLVPKHHVVFSRVIFNPKHTKACYYISQSLPENRWAGGEMIYVEKRQGKWFVLYRKLYWIT